MRWIFRIFMFLVLLVVVAVGILLMMPSDRIARIAADQISNFTGREVTMSGDTKISFYPVLGISTGAVSIANAEWAGAEPMFEANSLKIGVAPQALWGGDLKITGFEAVGPTVNLERSADGKVNWELGVAGVASSGQDTENEGSARSSRLALTLDRALITNATFRFTDHSKGETIEMTGLSVDLGWPENEGRATFDVAVQPGPDPVRVAGHIDNLADFIDGAISDLTANVSTESGTISFSGRASAIPEAEGRLSADIKDSQRFFAALGQPNVALPPFLGRALVAETDVTFSSEQRLSLRDMLLEFGSNRFRGGLDLELAGDKPLLAAQVDAGALDLSDLGGAAESDVSDSGSTSQSNPRGWSQDPIDASGLAMIDGQVAIRAESIDLGDLQFGKTRAMVTLDRSRLVVNFEELSAYQGQITGQFVANNRSGLSVGGDFDVTDIDLQSFLKDAAGLERLAGSANVNVKFLGVGQSQHDIMNSLSGEGNINAGPGTIAGLDLNNIMRSGTAGGGTTVFDSMSATFTMENGLLSNQDLVMEMPRAQATGKGFVGIGARTINYLFTPVILQGASGGGLAIPVRIKGSWDGPQIVPDLEAAINLNLAEEVDDLEDRLEEGIREAVEDELGVQVEDGDSVEDVLRRSLENEAKKGLLRLLE